VDSTTPLLPEGGTTEWTALHYAALNGPEDVVKALAQHPKIRAVQLESLLEDLQKELPEDLQKEHRRRRYPRLNVVVA